MFAKIKDGKIDFICDKKIQEDMLELTTEEYQKLLDGLIYDNGEFVKKIKTPEEIKAEKISKYRSIEQEAKEKRLEYVTAELLPDSTIKTMKLEKLMKEGGEIERKYIELQASLIEEYGEEILSELI